MEDKESASLADELQQTTGLLSSSWKDGHDSISSSLLLSSQEGGMLGTNNKHISTDRAAALGMTLSQASTSSSIPAIADSTTTTRRRNDLSMSSSSLRTASTSDKEGEAEDCSASSSSSSSSSTSSVSTSKYALHFDSSFSLSDSDDNEQHHIVFKNRSKNKKNRQEGSDILPSKQRKQDKKNGDYNKKKTANPSLPVLQDKKARATKTKKKPETYSSISVPKSQSARQLLSTTTTKTPPTTAKTKEPRKAKSARQLVKSPTSKEEHVGPPKSCTDLTTTTSKSRTKTKKKKKQESDPKKTSFTGGVTKSQSARQLVSPPPKSSPKTIKAHSARHLLESPTQEGDRIILPSTMVPPKQKKKKKSNVTKAEKTSPTREARPSSRTSMTLVDDFVSIYQDVMEKQDETHKKEKAERKKVKKHAKPKSMPKLNVGTDEISPKATIKPSSARTLRAATTPPSKLKSTKKLSKAKASSKPKARSDSSSLAAAVAVSSPAPSPRKVRHPESKSPSPRKSLTSPSKRFSFSPAVSPQVDGLRSTTIAKHMQEAAAAAAAASQEDPPSSPSSTCSGESSIPEQPPALGLPTPPLVSPEPRESPATVDDSNAEKDSKSMDVQLSNGWKEIPPSKSQTIDPPWPPVLSPRGNDSKPLLTITSPIGSPRGSVASLTNHFEKKQQSPMPLAQDSPSATAASKVSSPRPSLMNALRPPLATPRNNVLSPRNSLKDHFGKGKQRKKKNGSSSAASAPVTSSQASPLLKSNKTSSVAKTSPKPLIASPRSGRSTQRLQKKSPLVSSTRKNKSLSDHFGNDSSSGPSKKKDSSSIVSAPVLGGASPRSSTISPSIASRLKLFEQSASSSDSFAKMPPPLPLETLSPKTESPSKNAQRRLLFAKSRSERGFTSSEAPVGEQQQGRRRGRISDFASPAGSRQRSMDKAVFSSSSSSKFTRTTSPSPLIRAKQRHALSARADAGDLKPLLQSGSSSLSTSGCQVAPLTTAQVQDKFHLDQEGVGNLSKVIQKTKHKVASSQIGGKHKEEAKNGDSLGLPGILRKSSSSFSFADSSLDDEEKRTTTVRFHTIVQTHRISLAGASFYTDEEIANFRYEKFCEDCGIDPADFD